VKYYSLGIKQQSNQSNHYQLYVSFIMPASFQSNHYQLYDSFIMPASFQSNHYQLCVSFIMPVSFQSNHYQLYVSFIMPVSFIGDGNSRIFREPIDLSEVVDKFYHISHNVVSSTPTT
jgi:hypothetical protein